MKKYFIIDGFRRLGPFDVTELKAQNINPQTIIWTFEQGERNAKDIPELAICFDSEVSKKENIIIEEPQKNDLQKEKEKKLLEEYEKIKKEKEDKQKIEQQQKLETPPTQPIVETQKNESQEDILEKEEKNEIEQDYKIEKNDEVDKTTEDSPIDEEKQVEFKLEQTQYQSTQNTSYSSSFEIKYNKNDSNQAKKTLYFGLSLLNLLFCCFPLGIVAIIFSSNAKKAFDLGDVEQGNKKASTALFINIISIILGLIFWIILIANVDK